MIRVQVPESEHWYDDYLSSDHWQDIRQLALERAQHRCVTCNSSKSLHVHHRNYSRLGNERIEDLTVLCADCHALFHANRKLASSQQRAGKQVVSHRGVITDWGVVFGGDLSAPNPDNLRIQFYAADEERNWIFECNFVDQNGTPGGIHYRALVEAMIGRKLRKRERVSRDRLRWMFDDRRVIFDVVEYPDHPDIEPRVVNLRPVEPKST